MLDGIRSKRVRKERSGGIGPTYADKSQRNGIRIIDLLSREKLQERLKVPLAEKNELLQKIYGIEPLIIDGNTISNE